MTIKVQGETYNSPEEIITAIGELSAQLEDLPESHKGRADLERHIERLQSAVAPSDSSPLNAEVVDATVTAADESPIMQDDPPPVSEVDPDDDDDDEDGVPPGYIKCPVCLGGGLLSEDAPVSLVHERCPDCNGYGKVLTGSLVPGHEQADCKSCTGYGWISARTQYETPTHTDHAAAAPQLPGAIWNADEQLWDPPSGDKPWAEATWDRMKGGYV